MIDPNNLPTEAQCKRTSTRLNPILSRIFDYADRKKLNQDLFDEYDELAEVWDNFPEGWDEQALGMLAAFSVVGSRKHAAAFLRSQSDNLIPDEARLARLWRTVPWTYVVLTDIKPLGRDLLRAVPLGDRPKEWADEQASWDELVVYSPSLSRSVEDGVSTALVLLWWAGEFFGTYGIIIRFRSIDADDILFYTAAVDSDDIIPAVNASARAVSDGIGRSPIDFLLLSVVQDAPRISGRDGDWIRVASTVALPMEDSKVAAAAGDLEFWRQTVEKAGATVDAAGGSDGALILRLVAASPMYAPELSIVPDRAMAYLAAMNRSAYERGREAVSGVLEFPAEPQSRASMGIFAAAVEELGYTDEPLRLNEALPDQPSAEEEPDAALMGLSMDELDSIMDRLTTNHNYGRVESDAEVARALDVSADAVRAVREKLDEMLSPGGTEPGGGWANSDYEVDRLDLSPAAFYQLTATAIPQAPGTFALRSFRERPATPGEESVLIDTPILRFASWLVGVAERGKAGAATIPATEAGNVALKVVKRALKEEVVALPEFREKSPRKEADVPVFQRYRGVLESAALLRLDGKRFVLDEELVALGDEGGDVGSLYMNILTAMFQRFRWDENPFDRPVPYLRRMAGFLLYAVDYLCRTETERDTDGWVPAGLLTDALVNATPPLAEAVKEDEADRNGFDSEFRVGVLWFIDLNVRHNFVVNFGHTLGLLEHRKGYTDEDIRVNEVRSVRTAAAFPICFLTGE